MESWNSVGKGPDMFIRLVQQTTGHIVVAEYRFHDERKWRFDYAIPDVKVAVEIDGAVWVGGRHVSPEGYIKDMEKLNTAASMGWLVLRFTTDAKFTTRTLALISETVRYRTTEQAEKK